MNELHNRHVFDLVSEIGRITKAEQLDAIPHRIRDLFGFRHVCYVASGNDFTEELYLVCTYPDEWMEWYNNASARAHDPLLKSIEEGKPVYWQGIVPKDDFGTAIMQKRFDLLGRDAVTLPIESSTPLGTALMSYVYDPREISEERLERMILRELSQIAVVFHGAVMRVKHMTSQNVRMSDRHIAILQFLASGMNEQAIASILEISERTVKQHIAEAKTRLRARTKAHLIAEAIKHGYLKLTTSSR